MLTITERPLNVEELRSIQPSPRSTWARAESWFLTFMVPFFILMLTFLWVNKYLQVSSLVEGLISIGIVGVSILLTGLIRKRLSGPHEPSLTSATTAQVIHVRTDRALLREDPDDLGRSFYLEVETRPAKCLFLWGHQLDELSEEGLFPNTEFVLTRIVGLGEHLKVELRGKPFQPERTLPPFTRQQFKVGLGHNDGDIINFPLDAILD